MRYLKVDGMLSGTGIRDAIEGGYVKPDELGLSIELQNEISNWLERYADAHYRQFRDDAEIEGLDSLGMQICARVRRELPDSKVEYFSSARMRDFRQA